MGKTRPILYKRLKAALLLAALAVMPALAARNLAPSEVDSRYFADARGRTFVPVGCNICFPRMYVEGSAGCGQPWHWDHMYIDGNDLWWHFARFAEAVKGVDPAAEHFRPTRRLRIWGLRGERTTLMWCRDKLNTWESELVRGEAPKAVSGEKLPFACKFECYLPWENRWTVATRGNVLPDFTRSIVVKVDKR